MGAAKVLEWMIDWEKSTKRFDNLFCGLNELLVDLGCATNDLRFILFFSISKESRVYFFDTSNRDKRYYNMTIAAGDEPTIESDLIELFQVNRSNATITYILDAEPQSSQESKYSGGASQHNVYGMMVEFQSPVESFFLETVVNHFCIDYTNKLPRGLFYIDKAHNQRIMHSALRRYLDIDMFSTLSGSLYEKRAPHGGLLLVEKSQPVEMKLSFKQKYPLTIDNVRQIRKLLEMTTEDMFLVVNKGFAIGLGIRGPSNKTVRFLGHQRWSFFVDDSEALLYKQGRYTIPENANKNYMQYFPVSFTVNNQEYILEILENLQKQKQGALLIMTDEAESEVNRLSALERGYAITPIDMKQPGNRLLLTSLSSIDGAIFVDRHFICYGIGVILDGIALDKGLSSRGARYNSAKCYVDNKEPETFVAIIISEDETVDIVYKPIEDK